VSLLIIFALQVWGRLAKIRVLKLLAQAGVIAAALPRRVGCIDLGKLQVIKQA